MLQENELKRATAFSTASMVLGISGIVLSINPFASGTAFVMGALALIFGIIALSKKSAKGQSITGVVLGSLAMFISIVVIIASILFLCWLSSDEGSCCDDSYEYYYNEVFGDEFEDKLDDFDDDFGGDERINPGAAREENGEIKPEETSPAETTNAEEANTF